MFHPHQHTHTGHYFYFASNTLNQPSRILEFPLHSQICGLSFSYYVSGPLELGIIRENLRYHPVYMTQSVNDSASTMWNRAELNFTISEFVGRLFFEVSPFDLGEAAVDPDTYSVFLGIDDVTLVFCLPCDYDSLGVPGGLVLSGPSEFTMRLRLTSQLEYNASSAVCPEEELEYDIESG